MGRRNVLLLLSLSLIWGASFMFIKVGVRGFEPEALAWLRLATAAAVLVPVALLARGRGALRQGRASIGPLTAVGLVNSAIPFFLIAWAETRIDSGLTAILQASAPLFTVLILVSIGAERVGGARLVGVLMGFAGVAMLVGVHGGSSLAAVLAVILSALGYAGSGVYIARRLRHVDALVIGAGSLLTATVLTAPIGVAKLPSELPGWKEIASVLVLGIAGTALAYVVYFALLRGAGASRAILVTYLVPGFAVIYGALLLGEPLRPSAIGGLLLILCGVGLAGRRARTRAVGEGGATGLAGSPAVAPRDPS